MVGLQVGFRRRWPSEDFSSPGSVWDCTEHPGLVPVPRPPWGRKNCKAKPRSFPQKWLNLHTLQVKQATNRHKTAKNLMKNMIQCRIKTDRDSGLKTPSDAMRRVPGGSPDQKHPTWQGGVSCTIANRPLKGKGKKHSSLQTE